MTFFILIFAFFVADCALGQTPDIIVTASSLYHAGDHLGSADYTTTQNDIDVRQERTLAKALQDTPGAIFDRYGTDGRLSNLSLRGAKSSQTRVMFNGVPVNDPASGGGFDFGHTLSDDIEQAEVLPGSNGLIYGSEVVGGVLNIITKRGRWGHQQTGFAEVGSNDTRHVHAGFSGMHHDTSYALDTSFLTSGTGQLTNRIHGTQQGDDAQSGHVSSFISRPIAPNADVDVFFNLSQGDVKMDRSPAPASLPTASESFTRSRLLLGGAKAHITSHDDTVEHTFHLDRFESRLHSTYDISPSDATRGVRTRLGYRVDFPFLNINDLSLGFEASKEQAESTTFVEKTRQQYSLFVQDVVTIQEPWKLSLGARIDRYQTFGTQPSYRLATTYVWGDLTWRTSFATGFKAPVLSNIYNNDDKAAPNLLLKPEKSRSFDGGVDMKINDRLTASLTYFHLFIKDIVTPFSVAGRSQSINSGNRVTRGIEFMAKYAPSNQWSIQPSFTTFWGYDASKKRHPDRLPQLKVALRALYKPSKSWQFFGVFSGLSSKTDRDWGKGRDVRLPGYLLVDGGFHYNFNDNLTLQGRIENLFNKAFEDVYGYGNRGRTVTAGLKVTL